MRKLTLVVFAVSLAACASADRTSIAKFERDVDDIRPHSGLSVAIVKNQQILWTRGFGYADLENHIPATPDTLYSVASVTKTFGSTLIMQLVEQGKLSLDDPIAPYTRNNTAHRSGR